MEQKIFTGEVDYQWTPQPATLGASIEFLSAIFMHFDTAPTTSENLTVSLVSDTSAYEKVLYEDDPSEESLKDINVQWENGFALDPGDAIKVAYPNTDERTIEVTIKSRHF